VNFHPIAATISAIRWFIGAFTDTDGKASYSRMAGTYVLIKIVERAEGPTPVQGIMWDAFMILVGYQLLSKTLNAMSPAVLDIAKSMLLRAQGSIMHPPTKEG
jgi:hypothetical protein